MPQLIVGTNGMILNRYYQALQKVAEDPRASASVLGCMRLFYAICIGLQAMVIVSTSIVGGSAATVREGSRCMPMDGRIGVPLVLPVCWERYRGCGSSRSKSEISRCASFTTLQDLRSWAICLVCAMSDEKLEFCSSGYEKLWEGVAGRQSCSSLCDKRSAIIRLSLEDPSWTLALLFIDISRACGLDGGSVSQCFIQNPVMSQPPHLIRRNNQESSHEATVVFRAFEVHKPCS